MKVAFLEFYLNDKDVFNRDKLYRLTFGKICLLLASLTMRSWLPIFLT